MAARQAYVGLIIVMLEATDRQCVSEWEWDGEWEWEWEWDGELSGKHLGISMAFPLMMTDPGDLTVDDRGPVATFLDGWVGIRWYMSENMRT